MKLGETVVPSARVKVAVAVCVASKGLAHGNFTCSASTSTIAVLESTSLGASKSVIFPAVSALTQSLIETTACPGAFTKSVR